MKPNKNLFIILVTLIIGVIIGFCAYSVFFKIANKDSNNENKFQSNDYISKIKNSENKTQQAEEILKKLEELESKLSELESEKIEVQSEIVLLQNELNLVTDFEFEDEIYNNDESVEEYDSNKNEIQDSKENK